VSETEKKHLSHSFTPPLVASAAYVINNFLRMLKSWRNICNFTPMGIKSDWCVCKYVHTYIPLTLYPRRDSVSDISTFYKHYLFIAMRNTADVTGVKPFDVWSQTISCIREWRMRKVLFFYFVPDIRHVSI
jgi:hypothetical protein